MHWYAGVLNTYWFLQVSKPAVALTEGAAARMARPHSKDPSYESPYSRFFRFSFGPLLPETFDSDIELFREVFEDYRKEIQI